MKNLKRKTLILVCTHKPFLMFKDDILIPIQIGNKVSDLNLGYLGDDTGVNISDKNPNYCELTALYWAWKNLSITEIIGFCHYRRFFQFHFEDEIINSIFDDDLIKHKARFILDLDVFKNYDIILPRPIEFETSLYSQYSKEHNENDLILLRQVIYDLTPEFISSFDDVMQGTKFYPYNMFVMRNLHFDNYCSWLFRILFELEKRVDIPKDCYQRRIFGFLGERLLNVWVHQTNLKVKTYEVTFLKTKYVLSEDEFYNRMNASDFVPNTIGLRKLLFFLVIKSLRTAKFYLTQLRIGKN